MKKKLLISISIIVLIIILSLIVISMPSIKNDKYNKKIIDNIYSNTDLKNITYVNKSNNYYIVKIDNKVVVLDLNYETIFTKENIKDRDMSLVYKRNNIYYVEKIRKKNKLIYNYYSTDEDNIAFSSVVGGN